jgi:hypothetical protein
MTDRLPPLPAEFGKDMPIIVDYFPWIIEKRREPVSPLWFWVDEVMYPELEKAMAKLISKE